MALDKKKFSASPLINDDNITLVAITKEGSTIKYTNLNVNDIIPTKYFDFENTYTPSTVPSSSSSTSTTRKASMWGRLNNTWDTIRASKGVNNYDKAKWKEIMEPIKGGNKHTNNRKTKKAAKKHLSKRKRDKLNKHRKTHHK